MSTEATQAASPGTDTSSSPQTDDEIRRQSALATLATMLTTSMAMLARCEAQANAARGDRLGPVYAAAHLLHANANIAKALAHVGCVETRHRSIVEQVQHVGNRHGELNWEDTPLSPDAEREKLENHIDAIVEHSRRERERLEGLAIGCCI